MNGACDYTRVRVLATVSEVGFMMNAHESAISIAIYLSQLDFTRLNYKDSRILTRKFDEFEARGIQDHFGLRSTIHLDKEVMLLWYDSMFGFAELWYVQRLTLGN